MPRWARNVVWRLRETARRPSQLSVFTFALITWVGAAIVSGVVFGWLLQTDTRLPTSILTAAEAATAAEFRILSTDPWSGGEVLSVTCDGGRESDSDARRDPLTGIWLLTCEGMFLPKGASNPHPFHARLLFGPTEGDLRVLD